MTPVNSITYLLQYYAFSPRDVNLEHGVRDTDVFVTVLHRKTHIASFAYDFTLYMYLTCTYTSHEVYSMLTIDQRYINL